MAKFRHAFYKLVPSWLSSGDGEKVLYSLGLIKDAYLERMRQGLNARFPSRATPSANDLTGADRGILRGRDESDESYARRLIAWRYPRGHRVRGNAFALLDQIGNYWQMLVHTIDARGNLHTRETDGTETYSYGHAWDWDGAGVLPNYARFWVVLDGDASIEEYSSIASAWGGAFNTPGHTIGQTGVTPGDGLAMRKLFRSRRPWYPLGTTAEWLVLVLYDGDPDNSGSGTFPAPDGTWKNWSRNEGTARVRARPQTARFIKL